MSKPLRSKEIITYLKTKKYSDRVISETLNVSLESVRKVRKAIEGMNPEEIEKLLEMEDFEINMELKFKSDKGIPDSTFEEILEKLKVEGATCQSVYDSYNKDKKEDAGNGFPYCSYSVFNSEIKKYCERKGYSNRIKFKPGVFMEIGRIRRKSGNDLFYFYFPFSRALLVRAFSSYYPMQLSICYELLSFLVNKAGGVPSRIVCMERMNSFFSVTKGGKEIVDEYGILNDMLRFFGVLISKQENYCIFNRRKKNKGTGKDEEYKEPVAEKIDALRGVIKNATLDSICYNHNDEVIMSAFEEEKEALGQLPSVDYEYLYGKLAINKVNCHIKLWDRWYSCNYRHVDEDIFAFIAFIKNEIRVNFRLTNSKDAEVISSHIIDPKADSKYITNEEDLPETDAEARKFKLTTFDDIIRYVNNGFSQYNDNDRQIIIEVFKRYSSKKKPHPMTAYNWLIKLCRESVKNKEKIVQACHSIKAMTAENANTVESVGSMLFKAINPNKQSSDDQPGEWAQAPSPKPSPEPSPEPQEQDWNDVDDFPF